jgi:antitoxin (DNA-binding transcriptional repressor) of toxin-antitoxin stability system
MTVVTLEEAKTRMEELAHLAVSGEEVLITQNEKPTLALRPVSSVDETSGKRVGGQWEGRFVVGPEFFEPLPDEELDLWEGNSPRGRQLEEIGEAWATENQKVKGHEG